MMGILERVAEGKGPEVHLDGAADGWIGGEYLPLLLALENFCAEDEVVFPGQLRPSLLHSGG